MTQPRSLADQGSAAYPAPANFPSFAPLAPRPLPAQGNERIVNGLLGADAALFHHGDGDALFRQRQRGAGPGDAAADHHHAGAAR